MTKHLYRWHFPYRGTDERGRRCKRVRYYFREATEDELAYVTLVAYAALTDEQRNGLCGDIVLYRRVVRFALRRGSALSRWEKVERP